MQDTFELNGSCPYLSSIVKITAKMSVVIVQVAQQVGYKTLTPETLRMVVTKSEVDDIYRAGVSAFNELEGTDLDGASFQYSPSSDSLARQKIRWESAAQYFPKFTASLSPQAHTVLQGAKEAKVNDMIKNAVDMAIEAQTQIMKQEIADSEARGDLRLAAAIQPLKKEINQLQRQVSLASPILIRKVIYKARQMLVEAVAPGTSANVENFHSWLQVQDCAAINKVVSAQQLGCLSVWGTTDGDIVAHSTIPNEEPVLASAVEDLEDGECKDILRSLFLLAFKVPSSAKATHNIAPIEIKNPGPAIIGK